MAAAICLAAFAFTLLLCVDSKGPSFPCLRDRYGAHDRCDGKGEMVHPSSPCCMRAGGLEGREAQRRRAHSGPVCDSLALATGQEVMHTSRGSAHVVCFSSTPGRVGICGKAGSGHDNWKACRDCPHGLCRRSSSCGPSSLWFVNCKDLLIPPPPTRSVGLRPEPPISLPGHEVSVGVRPEEQHCGCAWNSERGCGVSSERFVTSVTQKLELAAKSCRDEVSPLEEDLSPDCQLRLSMMKTSKNLAACLHMSPSACAANSVCQWGAQGSGSCGIDEEQLVVSLADPKRNRLQPILKLVLLHDRCNTKFREVCNADSKCSWQSEGCDVKPSLLTHYLLSKPEVAFQMQQIGMNAECLTRPHSACNSAEAPHFCKLNPAGFCNLDATSSAVRPLEENLFHDMVNSVCEHAWEEAHQCLSPCKLSGRKCSGSHVFYDGRKVFGKDFLAPRSFVQVMSLIALVTRDADAPCVHLRKDQCLASSSQCSGEELRRPAPSEVGHGPFVPNVGWKGALQKAATAVAAGDTGAYLKDFWQNNPEVVQNLTTAMQRFAAPSLSAAAPSQQDDEYEDDEDELDPDDASGIRVINYDPDDEDKQCSHAGEDVVARKKFDLHEEMGFISSSAFESEGLVDSVEAYAHRADGAFQVHVWRPTPLTYHKVGSVTVSLSKGVNKIGIASRARIEVRKGDVLGWYSPGLAPIVYTEGGDVIVRRTTRKSWVGGQKHGGMVQELSKQRFPGWKREYSIQARVCHKKQRGALDVNFRLGDGGPTSWALIISVLGVLAISSGVLTSWVLLSRRSDARAREPPLLAEQTMELSPDSETTPVGFSSDRGAV